MPGLGVRRGLVSLFLFVLGGGIRPALPCYACFAKSARRFCTNYVVPSRPGVSACWLLFKRLMSERPVYWVRVAASDYKQLKSIYSQALRFIKRRRRDMPSESYVSLLDAVEREVLYKVYGLKEATPCNQTCGINVAATYFDCIHCKLHDCDGIPFDCPIEEVRINETGHVSMKCQASFGIPKIDTVTWWLAPLVRSDIIQQFKVLHVGSDDTLSINNVKTKNTGSYACDIVRKNTILLRRFFYLIVTRSTLQSSIDLQAMFQNVLAEKRSTLKPPVARPIPSPDQRLRRRTETQLTVAIALATMFVMLCLGGVYRWVN